MARNLHLEISDRILAALRAGVVPWRQPWHVNSTGSSAMPSNFATGRAYSGVNVPLLWLTAQERGYSSQQWLTFKQALDLGGNVRKGEKSTPIVFVGSIEREDEQGDPRRVSFLKSYAVFNVAQCDGLKLAEPVQKVMNYDGRNALFDEFVAATGVDLRHGEARAYYRPAGDFVMMPRFESFVSGDAYCSTLAHELIHWTGSDKRLAREFGRRFGDKAYSVEELTAEMGAAFVCAEFGIDNEDQQAQTAAYIDHWIKAIQADDRIFMSACAAASKAVEFCRDLALADAAKDLSRAA